jgi:D-beta-D-heptose 7-phosphate kinase/D-beta-D-heptose 1-phosphate adenosyltransferase
MSVTKEQIYSILEKMQGLEVLVVGDLILDRYVWGTVDRISPEAPVPVVRARKMEDRSGGAGNVVNNLVNLGCRVKVTGFIGDDDEGRILSSIFDSQKVNREGIIKVEKRPTSLKTRVIAQRQQLLRIDREETDSPGVALSQGLAAVVESQMTSAQAVIISDYGKGTIGQSVLNKLSAAKKSGHSTLSKCPLVLDPHPANYALYSGFNVAKPNKKEAEAASGISIKDKSSAEKAAEIIRTKWNTDLALITMGEDGVLISQAGQPPLHLKTRALDVFDVSGAGDTVTAVYTAALAAGADTKLAGHMGNLAAGVVVAEVGTVAITVDAFRNHVEKIWKLEGGLNE